MSQSKKSVKSFDYEADDGVYAWENNEPIIRPENYMCPSCHHRININKKKPCRKCENCGFMMKSYHDNKNGYDEIYDDADYDNSPQLNFSNKYKKVKFASKVEYIPEHKNIEHMTNDSENNSENKSENKSEPESESEEDKKSYAFYIITIVVSVSIFMLLLSYCVAYSRGELLKDNLDSSVNWALIACIFFFHQLYLSYVLVDWITSPKHHCSNRNINHHFY